MKILLKLSVPLLLIAVASGCASLNEDECMTADWEQIGFEDGSGGAEETRISSHRKACAKHGVTPDLAAYRKGHAEGVKVYCEPYNGYEAGRQGGLYTGVCAGLGEAAFLEAFNAGKRVYDARLKVNDLESEMSSTEYKLEKTRKKLREAEQSLKGDLNADDRERIYQRIGDIKQELGALEERHYQVVKQLAEAEGQLNHIINTTPTY